jgi:hypothetical protein
MLNMVGEGSVFPVKRVSHIEEYENMKAKMSDEDFDAVWDFLESDLLGEKVFSCSTKYPMTNQKAWRGSLSKLFEAAGRNVEVTGYFLGLLVMDIIINADEQWLCTKTNITKRDFATLCYWKTE